jgi:hypothetical protein
MEPLLLLLLLVMLSQVLAPLPACRAPSPILQLLQLAAGQTRVLVAVLLLLVAQLLVADASRTQLSTAALLQWPPLCLLLYWEGLQSSTVRNAYKGH